MKRASELLAIAGTLVTLAIPSAVFAQIPTPTYNPKIDCSTSQMTGRLSGSLRISTQVNTTPFSTIYSVTLPRCSTRPFDDAEIFLRGWKIGRWSDSRFDTAITISVSKVSFDPATGVFKWNVTADSDTMPNDESDYLIAFEILQVTNGFSGVERVSHSCTGSGGCSVTKSVPLPALPVRGLALASMTLTNSVTDPYVPGPTEVMVDVGQFAVSGSNLDSTMKCRFDRAASSTNCDTEAVIVMASNSEAATGRVDVHAVNVDSSSRSSILLTDGIATNFRLCGQEMFRLSRQKPNPPNLPPDGGSGGYKANDTTYSMWAGTTDDQGVEVVCGGKTFNSFSGNWWYFFGSTGFVYPSPYIPPAWFDLGVPSGDPLGTMQFDADASILATKFF